MKSVPYVVLSSRERGRVATEENSTSIWRPMVPEQDCSNHSSHCSTNPFAVTYVRINPCLDAKILSFRASTDSPANWGSSLTSILYRETSIVRMAIPSISENLKWRSSVSRATIIYVSITNFLPIHARAPTPLWAELTSSKARQHTSTKWQICITGPILKEARGLECMGIRPVLSCKLEISLKSSIARKKSYDYSEVRGC